MIRATLFVALILFCGVFAAAQKQYNGWPPMAPNNVQHSGRFTVNNVTGKALFYYLNEATAKPNNKLIIWLSGGPGCASLGTANLFENEGPMTINETTGEFYPSQGPWTDAANVMWLDQPCGVGFSTCGSGPADTNTEEAAEDFFNFLQQFMDYYPQYRDMEVFISAESFGGVWGTVLSWRVWAANAGLKPQGKYKINLQGVTLGNGLTDPTYQYPQYPHLAYQWCKSVKGTPCVSESTYKQMLADLPRCLELIEACNVLNQTSTCFEATSFCNAKEMDPYLAGGWNFYDITKKGSYDMSAITKLLNQRDVQLSLFGDTKQWQGCNMSVNQVYSRSWEHDRGQKIIQMLEGGVRIMMYGGTYDFAVNWLGVKAWTLSLQWAQQKQFLDTPDALWFVDEKPAGSIRTIPTKGGAFGYSFATVDDACHMVPHSKPKQALALIKQFINGEPFPTWPGPLMPQT